MATNLQPTVNDILQIISDFRGESSTNTDAIRIRAVSRANQDFAKRKFWKFYRLDNVTKVGDGTNNYEIGSATYPMRYKGLTEVFVAKTSDTDKTLDSMRHDIIDFNVYKELFNDNNSDQICYEWFDTANDLWKVHINPAPAATDTITYTYYWEPPTLTTTTAEVICPNPNIIAKIALAQIYEGEDEQDTALNLKQEVEQLIAECIALENSPAVNQRYSMKPTGKGIGTY